MKEIKKVHLAFLIFLLCFTLTSCQYHLGYGELTSRVQTFSIPYVQGDQTGELTAEIIKKMTNSNGLTYQREEGDLLLEIKLLDLHDENIGFGYQSKNKKRFKKSIVPLETRLHATAEVKFIENCSKAVIKGPARLTVYVDFDHASYRDCCFLNVFSLGQLGDYEAAKEAVKTPLYRQLAEKIVDFLNNSW